MTTQEDNVIKGIKKICIKNIVMIVIKRYEYCERKGDQTNFYKTVSIT